MGEVDYLEDTFFTVLTFSPPSTGRFLAYLMRLLERSAFSQKRPGYRSFFSLAGSWHRKKGES